MQFGLHHYLHSFVDNHDLVLCPSYSYLRHGWESNERNSVEEPRSYYIDQFEGKLMLN